MRIAVTIPHEREYRGKPAMRLAEHLIRKLLAAGKDDLHVIPRDARSLIFLTDAQCRDLARYLPYSADQIRQRFNRDE